MLALLALALLQAPTTPAAAPPDPQMGPGVSRALAEHRARQIANPRYALALDVTRRDTVVGEATLRFERRRPGDVVVDFRGPALSDAVVNGRPLAPVDWNGAHLRIPAAALRDGENSVRLAFRAAIAPAGASVIRFHDAADGADYLYTLLVPADANALFPCFDQPDLKARVALALTTPRGWTALANGALASADSASSPRATTFRFRETEPLSSYLVAFAAGPWATHRATAGGRPITMYVRASRAAEAEGDSLVAANARAIAWLERYTARPYPFQKYDFLLAPAFPFGGMEHPGAVFYNEETFVFRERPTLNQLLGREATIYHEVAHQWFGDLVTMRWFDDLWLKEGFSTYLAAVMQDALSPRASAWKTFYLRNKPAAYAVDASRGTTPVYQPLANLDQAKSNYGAIVYNKAPGVLKQLAYLTGDDAFREGLRRYVRAHAFGNATWRDLLAAVGAASGRDLAPWGAAYVLRPGMPVIEQELRGAGGEWAVRLVQRPAQPLSGAAPWPVRTRLLARYADGTVDTAAVTLGAAATVRLRRRERPSFVFANAGDQAYALVHLDSASVRWVEAHVGEVRDPLLRPMLWGALWDLVRDARLDPARFVRAALRELPAERDEQVAPFLVARLTRAAEAYLGPADDAALRPELERVLRAGAADTSRPYSVRKAQLDAYVALGRSPAALAHLDALLDSAAAAGAPLRAPTRWAIVTALVARGAPGAPARLAAESRRDSTSDGRRRAFVAGAAVPDSAAKRRYWERYFGDRELNEDWATASLGAFNAPEHERLTLPYLAPALDSLPWIQRNRRIFFLGSWLGAFMQGQRTPEALARVERFLGEHPALPADLRQKVLQAGDELARTVRVRAAFAR